MMNLKLIFLMLLALFIAGNSAQAGTTYIDKGLEKNLVKICKALKSDSKMKIKHAIENTHIRKEAVLRGLVCNGMTPLTFALSHNANESAQYLVGQNGTATIAYAQKQLLDTSPQTMTKE